MKKPFPHPRTITTPQRALIIQRILVDNWTSDKVAATFDVPERLVDVWVADYRRHGMASLRRASGKTIVAGFVRHTRSRPLRIAVRKVLVMLHRPFVMNRDRSLEPLRLRRSNDDGRGGAS